MMVAILGNVIWILGLAGIPSDIAQWASWLPMGLLTNPGFYGPMGALALYATYDLLLRDRVLGGEEAETWAEAHDKAWAWVRMNFARPKSEFLAIAYMLIIILAATIALWMVVEWLLL